MNNADGGPIVPEDSGRLMVIERCRPNEIDLDTVSDFLRKDLVVLIRGVGPEDADWVIHDVANKLGLADNLALQAGFADSLSHRHRVGRYFMSVNKREDYQFIPPHSEGNTFAGMQLASFYCFENSTDGGETILMNVDESSDVWASLRERVRRGRLGSRSLAPHEIQRARGLYRLNLPSDIVRTDDQILEEHPSKIPGLTILDVLAKPSQTHSVLSGRKVYVYWDSIGSIDFDSSNQYATLLKRLGLLKEPDGGLNIREMDGFAHRHIWHSGVDYSKLFRGKITLKMLPGDLIVQNNLSWTHSATNWSPGSGTRNISAAFA